MIATKNVRLGPVTAGAGQTVFGYTGKVFDPEEFKIWVQLTGTTPWILKTYPGDYDVTQVGQETGNIEFVTGLVAGDKVVGQAVVPGTQQLKLPPTGGLPGPTVEEQVDRLTRQLNYIEDKLLGGLFLDDFENRLAVPSLPAPVAANFLAWSNDLTRIVNTIAIAIGTATSVDELDNDPTKDKMLSNLLANLWEGARIDLAAHEAIWDIFNALLTTKGDLLSFSTARARLGVGIAGQRLVPDPAEATGLKWANQFSGDAKSGPYTIVAADQNKIFSLSGASFTISLPPAATVGAGFTVWFHHNGTTGTNIYTIDPDGTETIDEELTDNLHTNSETLGISSDGTNWHVISRNVPTRQHVIQVVEVHDGAVATGTTAMVSDDTIPQNTEGDEYMTLAITPTSVSHKLKIEVEFNCAIAALGSMILALFQDSVADALASIKGPIVANNISGPYALTFHMAAGTIAATTFKVRAGAVGATTMTFNGESAARKLGGVMASSITITEYEDS